MRICFHSIKIYIDYNLYIFVLNSFKLERAQGTYRIEGDYTTYLEITEFNITIYNVTNV